MSRTQVAMGWLVVVAETSAAASAGGAQIVQSVVTQPVTACTVTDTASTGDAGMLLATCGGSTTLLGSAESYSSVSNVANGSVLVVRQRGGRTTVLLVSLVAGGSGVHVDDITRDLAALGGRAGDLGLGAIRIDPGRFAIDGSIGIVSGGSAKSLDLKSYVGRAAALTNRTSDK